MNTDGIKKVYFSGWWLLLSVPIALVIAGVVAACSGGQAVDNGGDTSIGLENAGAHFWQNLGDGTKVQCWYITKNRGYDSGTGGPTCDWVGYHQTYNPKPPR